MNTEITKISDLRWLQGWVLYDGHCPFCCSLAARFEAVLTRRGFDLAPLQSAWVSECLNEAADLCEMRVLTLGGRWVGGADAIVFLARRIWWAWPLFALAQLPLAMPILRRAYRFWAARRHCRPGSPEQAGCPLNIRSVVRDR